MAVPVNACDATEAARTKPLRKRRLLRLSDASHRAIRQRHRNRDERREVPEHHARQERVPDQKQVTDDGDRPSERRTRPGIDWDSAREYSA